MVRVRYGAAKTATISADEKARYMAISAEVAKKGKDKKLDATAAAARIEKALVELQTIAPWDPVKDDAFDEKDKDFVGVMLGGVGNDSLSKGELEVNTKDCVFEEPRVIGEDPEDPDESELRGLWCDGEKDPAEADEE